MIRKHLHKIAAVTLGVFFLFVCSIAIPTSPQGSFVGRFWGTNVAQAAIWSLDEMLSILAGIGGAGGVVLIVAYFSGYTGAVALVVALATLGGPFGMLGGIFAVAGIAILIKYLANYGLKNMMTWLVMKWKKNGKSLYQIKRDIDDLPGWIVPDSIKYKAKYYITECW